MISVKLFIIFLPTASAYVRQLGAGYDSNPYSVIPANLVTDDSRKDALAAEIKSIYIGENELFASVEQAVVRVSFPLLVNLELIVGSVW